MKKNEKTAEASRNVLDTLSQKRRRGRPRKVVPGVLKGRAQNYRAILQNVWERLSPSLLQAQTEDDVIRAFQNVPSVENEFAPQAALILSVVNEPNFPKRRLAQINFLGDSLAALGVVSARRSRDICARERANAKRAHHILRYEFYVECSCGYKGRSENHACRRCG